MLAIEGRVGLQADQVRRGPDKPDLILAGRRVKPEWMADDVTYEANVLWEENVEIRQSW